MIDETLRQLVEFLKEASPIAWKILVKQVYLEAFGYFAWGIGLSFVSRMLWKFAKAQDDDYNDVPKTFSYIGSIVAILAALMLLTSAIQHVINPEFYVIRFLLNSSSE